MYNATFNKGQRRRKKRKPKTTDGKQNKRIAHLENILLPALEWKSRDINSFNAAITNVGYGNFPMFQLAQGDASDERVGDKVTLKSHNVSLSLTRADTSNIVRVIFAMTPSSTSLVLDDVLQYANYGVYGNAVFSSPYRKKASSTAKTYSILFDKVYNLTDDISTIVDKFKLKVPKKGRQVEFQGVASQMPDNYNLSLLAISDSTGIPHPIMDCSVRSKYIDL